jgi:hypothetical protein
MHRSHVNVIGPGRALASQAPGASHPPFSNKDDVRGPTEPWPSHRP